jgi:hypothetical protein
VRFKELPVLHSGTAGLELGVPELDRINHALNGLEHAEPLYEHLERVYEPDLRLNWLLEFDNRLDMESVAALYNDTGLVEYAEPDYLRPVYRETSDPRPGHPVVPGPPSTPGEPGTRCPPTRTIPA